MGINSAPLVSVPLLLIVGFRPSPGCQYVIAVGILWHTCEASPHCCYGHLSEPLLIEIDRTIVDRRDLESACDRLALCRYCQSCRELLNILSFVYVSWPLEINISREPSHQCDAKGNGCFTWTFARIGTVQPAEISTNG